MSDLQSYANEEADAYNIPESLFSWQINQESGWNPNAQNGNASGIAQFMPGTAAQYGVNVNDPYSSIAGMAQMDSDLYAKTGNWTSALTSYGTLANVPSSVLTSFNNVLNSLGIGSGSSSTTPTASVSNAAGAVAVSTPFIERIAIILVAIVLIAGAIYTYRK